MRDTPREKTLADYVATLRRGKWIIASTALVCAALAFAVSKAVTPSYQAQASIVVQDPNEALMLTGIGVPTNETPLQIALSHAAQVTRGPVVAAVTAQLHNSLSPAQLRHAVSVSVDPNSALVDITATSSSATQAAAIANAFARQDALLTTDAARRQYSAEALQLRRTAASASPSTRSVYIGQAARLETASAVASPVQVNTTARVPTAPSSPRTTTNTLAGLVFGLLLGMVLAYGRTELDRRLRRPTDVEELLDHPVIGTVREEALGLASASTEPTRNGRPAPAVADEEAFRVLRQNVRYLAAEPLGVVLVTSALAEEGKSTVAIGLAAANAATGKRTVLVECDLRRPVLASRLGLPDGPGLTDFLTDNAAPEDVVRGVYPMPVSADSNGEAGPAYSGGQRLACITAGTPVPRPTEMLASDRFKAMLAELSETYEVVILDGAPLLTVADALEIVPEVSGVVLCVRLGQTTRDQVHAVQTAIERLPQRPVGVVLTGVKPTGSGHYGYYGQSEQRRAPAAPAH